MEKNNELNEMRSQMAILKNALDNEKIVNTRLMRTVMGNKMGGIMREYVLQMLLIAVMIPYCGYILARFTDNSTAFIVVTELFFLIALAYHLYIYRGISTKAIVSGDLIDTGRRLAKLKLMTAQWQRFGIPFICLWLLWFYWENTAGRESPWLFIGISAGCAIAGAVWGMYRCRKQRLTIDELIRQIDELTKGE